jgi:putative membrane protein
MPESTSESRETLPESALRDLLAVERTYLSNERTLLAYIRTAVALAGGGAALIQLIQTTAATLSGWALILLGIVVLVAGSYRFLVIGRKIRHHGRLLPDSIKDFR